MVPLTDKEINSYEKQEVCYLCKEKFCTNKNEKKKNWSYAKKSKIIAITHEILEELLIVFAI